MRGVAFAWGMLVLAAACGDGTGGGDDTGTMDTAPDIVEGGTDADSGPPPGLDDRCLPLWEAAVGAAERYGAAGGGFALVLEGALVCTVPYGAERRESGSPLVTTETWFRWPQWDGLVMKLAALELADAGALDLDASVESLVGDLDLEPAVWASALTVRHLVWGRSGLPSTAPPFAGHVDFGEACAEDGPSARQWWDAFEDGGRVMWAEPGFTHTYGRNEGVLLQLVLEEVTGESVADTIQRTIFDPVGMDNSRIGFGPEHHERQMYGYVTSDISTDTVTRLDHLVNACGAALGTFGLTTTLDDAARLTLTLARGGVDEGGARVLAESSMAALVEPRGPTWNNFEVAAGPVVYLHEGAPLLHTPSHLAGFSGGVTLVPDAGFGVIELSNLDYWRIRHVAEVAAVERYVGAPWPNANYEVPMPWEPSDMELSEYAGAYVAPIGCLEDSIELQDGRLVARGFALVPRTPDRFKSPAGHLAFWRRDGAIAELLSPADEFAFYPVDAVPPEIAALASCP